MPSRPQPQPLIYRIDAQNRIISVNEAWSDFARENNGRAVMPENILGSDLISSISDPTIRELYLAMIRQARNSHAVKFQYRCDAPDKRRLFSMHISGKSGEEVEFVSTLIREENRQSVAFLEPDQPRNDKFLRVCSWCQQVALSPDDWVPVETALKKTGIMEDSTMPAITHGICPECATSRWRMSSIKLHL